MEVQRRVELSVPAASEAVWQPVGVIATSILAGVATDGVKFEAVSGEERVRVRRTGPRADRSGRQL